MDTEYHYPRMEGAPLSDSDMQARLKRFAPDIAYAILSETELMEDMERRMNDLYQSHLSCIVFLNMRDGARADEHRKLVIWRGGVLWHILLFKYDGRQRHISILNHYFKTCVQEVEAVRDILTGEYPRVRRITFPFVFLAEETVKRPRMTVGRVHEKGASDKVLEVPESMDAYMKSLGAKTRQKMRNCWKRIAQDFPDVKVLHFEGAGVAPELVRRLVEMNSNRMAVTDRENAQGYVDEQLVFAHYMRHAGVVCVLATGDRIIGGSVNVVYRDTAYGVVIAHDTAFSKYSAGNLVLLSNVQLMIGKKLKYYHWMWGNQEYKERFGAREQCIWDVTAFRRNVSGTVPQLRCWLAWVAWRCRFTVKGILKKTRWKLEEKNSLPAKLYGRVRKLLRRQ